MIRSIAYELFNRLTTDPDMLREKLAESERIRYKLADDLLNHTMGPVAFARNQQKADLEAEQLQVRELQSEISQCNKYNRELFSEKCKAEEARTSSNRAIAEFRDRLQTIVDEQLGQHETLGFDELLTCVEDGLRKASRAEAQLLLQRDKSDLTIEPTWILALWSIHAEGWTESKRGSYDAMIAEMHRSATAWNLFPRSQWDALVKNGRAR